MANIASGCEMYCSQWTTVNSCPPKLLSSVGVNCLAKSCGKSEVGSGLCCGMEYDHKESEIDEIHSTSIDVIDPGHPDSKP